MYYYTNDDELAIHHQVNQVRKTKLQEAGFTVKDLGVPNKERRRPHLKLDGPHNMLQSPGGWCFDWPSADSIFPPMVSSTQIRVAGTSWGNLSDAVSLGDGHIPSCRSPTRARSGASSTSGSWRPTCRRSRTTTTAQPPVRHQDKTSSTTPTTACRSWTPSGWSSELSAMLSD